MSILANWIVLVFNALYNSQNVYETLAVYDSMVKTIMQTDTFEALSSIIMTIGISMMLIYFFMDLSDKVTTKSFGTEQLFRAFMILFVSYVLLLYTDELIYGFLDLGLSLGQSFTGEDPTSSYFTSERIEMLENGLDKVDLGGSIFHIAGLIFPYLLSLVANLSLFFIGITRIVELTVRSLFAPMAVTDCIRNGSSSNGIRYLKKIFALALQIVVVVAINIVIGLILTNIGGGGDELINILEEGAKTEYYKKSACEEFIRQLCGGDRFVTNMGILVAKIGLMFGSLRICNDIVGV